MYPILGMKNPEGAFLRDFMILKIYFSFAPITSK